MHFCRVESQAVAKLHQQLNSILKLKPVDELDVHEMTELLNDLRPVEEDLQKLRKRWAHFNPELGVS